MMVARQFIAWYPFKNDPSLRDGVIKSGRRFFLHWTVNSSSGAAHTVPPGQIFF